MDDLTPSIVNRVIITGYSSCSFYNEDKDPSYKGTFGFIAPEVLNLNAPSRVTNSPYRDIWSLGAVIYFICSKEYVLQMDKLNFDEGLVTANFEGNISLNHRYFTRLSETCTLN